MANDPNDVKAVYNPEAEVTDNYFGGEGTADGPWHGHIRVDEQGSVLYEREAGEKE